MKINNLDNEFIVLLKLSYYEKIPRKFITIFENENKIDDIDYIYTWKDKFYYMTLNDFFKKKELNSKTYKFVLNKFYECNHYDILSVYYKENKSDESLEVINKLISQITNIKKISSNDLVRIYNNNMKSIDTKLLEEIENSQEIISNIKVNIEVSKYSIKSTSKYFKFDVMNDIYKNNIIDIFNNIKCNKNIVFVKMINNGVNNYKMYKDFNPRYIRDEKKYTNNNYIYINYYDDITNKYKKIEMNISEMTIIIYSLKPNDNLDIILSNLLESIEILYLNNIDIKLNHIKAEFNIYGISYDKNLLASFILLDIFSYYFYNEESIKVINDKKRFDLNLKSDILYFDKDEDEKFNYSVSSLFNILYLESNKDEVLFNGTKKRYNPGEKYINIKISKCANYSKLEEFYELVKYMFQYYIDKNIEEEYKNTVRKIYPKINFNYIQDKKVEKTIQRKKRGGYNVEMNKETGGTYRGYTREFQNITIKDENGKNITVSKQAIRIKKEDVEKYRKKGYQVIKFPDPNSKYEKNKDIKSDYYTCAHKKLFIGLGKVKNINMKDNSHEYTPACYKKDKISNLKKEMSLGDKSNNKYARYLMGLSPKKTKGGINITKSNKILAKGSAVEFVNDISILLKNIDNDIKNIYRLGTINSPNSVLECLLLVKDMDSKINEKILDNLRKKIYLESINTRFSENYSQEKDELLKYMILSNEFLDPMKVISILENYFKVNILLFTPLNKKENDILIPYYNKFYIKNYNRDYPSIIIYYNKGEVTENLKYPQCELIYHDDKQCDFGNKILEFYENSINKITNYYLINNLTIYEPIFKDITFNLEVKFQYLDGDNKTRGFLTVDNISIFFIPTYNYNIPVTNEIFYKDINYCFDKLGQPGKLSIEKDYIIGLWYYNENVYIPINKVKLNETYENIPITYNSININKDKTISNIDRLYKLEKNLYILKQLLNWIIINIYNKYKSLDIILEHINYRKDEKYYDTSIYYDFSDIPRKLPTNIDLEIEQYIKYLSLFLNKESKLIKNNTIYLHDKDFYDKILYFIDIKRKILMSTPEKKEIKYIDNYYNSNKDFNDYEDTILILTKTEFNFFLSSKKYPYKELYKLNKVIYKNNINKYNPLLYENNNGKVYIIQNVFSNNLKKALQNSENWILHGINEGFNPKVKSDIKDYKVYFITDKNHLVHLLTMGNGKNRVLYYGSLEDYLNKRSLYASLLKIK